MSNQLPEAIHVFDKYHACPLCSKGVDVVNESAVYHELSFTHRQFQCKDCNQVFLVPESIKLNAPKPFKKKVRQPANRGA